jgi:glutathione S-transferase
LKTLISRRASFAALAGAAIAPALADATSAEAATAATPLPKNFTIYHLEGRRSERVIWLMEELGLPYNLVFTQGDLGASMDAIRKISPIVPMAPTIQYGDQVLVESGSIIELILNRHAPGKLAPAISSHDYPTYLRFMHFAEGSLADRLFSDYRFFMANPPKERSPLVDSEAVVSFCEEQLTKQSWFGGAEFSGADIMQWFPLNVATALNLVDTARFPHVAEWKTRVEARPAFKRMRAKALPKGMVGNLTPLPKHAPSGPRASGK